MVEAWKPTGGNSDPLLFMGPHVCNLTLYIGHIHVKET